MSLIKVQEPRQDGEGAAVCDETIRGAGREGDEGWWS